MKTLALVPLLALAAGAAAAPQYRIEPIDPFADGSQVNALRVNAGGTVLVQRLSSGDRTGWWSGGPSEFARLPDPNQPGDNFRAVGIADDGTLVGQDTSILAAGHRLTRAGVDTPIMYGSFPVQSIGGVAPSGLSAGIQSVTGGGFRGAFRAPVASASFIAPLSDIRLEAVVDANSAGTVIGISYENGVTPTAWIARGDRAERLALPAGTGYSDVIDLDSRGRVLGVTGFGQTGGFTLWNEAGTPSLLPFSTGVRATGMARMNASDRIIGSFSVSGAFERAGVYESGAVTLWPDLLDSSQAGWGFLQFNDLSDSGYIVGVGTFNGVQRGFRMTPLATAVPEPATLAALGLGALALLRRRKG